METKPSFEPNKSMFRSTIIDCELGRFYNKILSRLGGKKVDGLSYVWYGVVKRKKKSTKYAVSKETAKRELCEYTVRNGVACDAIYESRMVTH